MTLKNKKLNNLLLLATASSLVLGASNAMAAPDYTTNGNAVMSTGVGIVGGAVVTNKNILINGNHDIAGDVDGTFGIAVADGVNPGALTAVEDLVLTAVSNDDTGNPAGGAMELTFGAAAKTVTLNGAGVTGGVFTSAIDANSATTYNQLGATDFGGFADAKVLVTGHGLTLPHTFDNKGIIEASAASYGNTFSAAIGGAGAITKLDIKSNKGGAAVNDGADDNVFEGTVTADDIVLSGAVSNQFEDAVTADTGDITTGDGTVKMIVADKNITAVGGSITLGKGGLTMAAGTGDVNAHTNITLSATAGAKPVGVAHDMIAGNDITTGAGNVEVVQDMIAGNHITTGAGNVEVDRDMTAVAGNISTGAGEVVVSRNMLAHGDIAFGAGDVAVGGTTTATTGNITTGDGAATFTGTVTANAVNKTITVGTGGAEFGDDIAVNHASGKVHFAANAGKITLNTDANHTVTAHKITTAADGEGLIEVNRATTFAVDSIGEANAELEAIKVGTDIVATFNNGGAVMDVYSPVTSVSTGNTQVGVAGGAAVKFHSDIGEADATKRFATFAVSGAATTAEIDAGKTAYLAATNGVATFNDATAGIRLKAGSKLVGNVAATGADDRGLLLVGGDSTLDGRVDSTAGRFKGITFEGNHKLTVTNRGTGNVDSAIDVVSFNGTPTAELYVQLPENQNTTLTFNTGVTANNGVAGGGKITLDGNVGTKAVTLSGPMGAAGNRLSEIDFEGKALTLTSAGSYVNLIKADKVTLNAGTYFVDNVTDADRAKKYVTTGNVTLVADSKFGTEAAPLDSFTTVAGSTLTMQAGASLVSATPIASVVGQSGSFDFTTNTVGDLGTDAHRVTGITVRAGDATKLTGEVHMVSGADVSLVNTAKVEVSGNIHNGGIDLGAGTGLLTFTGASTVDGKVGVTNALAAVVNTDQTVTIGDAYNGTTLNFAKAGTLDLSAGVTALGAITAVDAGATLIIGSAYTTTADVATAGTKLAELRIVKDRLFTVAAGHKVNADKVTTDKANTSSVTFVNASDTPDTTWGSAELPFKLVTSTNGVVNQKDVFTKDFVLTNGTFTADNVVTAGGKSTLNGGTLVIRDGGSVAETTGAGDLTIEGNATVTGKLGSTGAIAINGDNTKKVVLKEATVSGPVTQGAAEVVLTKATTFEETYALNGGTLNVGSNKVTAQENVTLTGDAKVKFNYTAGQKSVITLDAGKELISTGTVTLLPGDAADALYPGNGSTIAVAGFADGTAHPLTTVAGGAVVAAANVKYETNGKSFIDSATYDPATGKITFAVSVTQDKLLDTTASANATEFAKAFAKDVVAGKASAAFTHLLEGQNEAGRSAVIEGAVNQAHTVAVADAAKGALEAAGQVVNNRAGTSVMPVMTSSKEALGMGASADAAERFGVWAQVLAGTGTQKARKGDDGFKSKWFGGVLGADTMVSDNASLGIMVGNVNTTVKLTDKAAGSKIKAPTWVFGAYGSYEFANNFFMQGNVAVAQLSAKSNMVRATGVNTTTTATAKFDVMTAAAEIRAGYNHKVDNVVVTPTIGLRASYVGDTSFEEKAGNAALNEKITTKSNTTVSAVAGLKLATAVDMSGTTLMPEAHFNVDYAFSARNPKATFAIGTGSVAQYKAAKPSRFGANVGFGVTAQTEGVDYGVGYDAVIAEKYVGHQGSVKVKVKF